MINIKIVSVGDFKEKYYVDFANEYSKRIKKFANISFVVLKDESNKMNPEIVKKLEAAKILDELNKDNNYVILLDLDGKELDSVEFAHKIDEIATYNNSNITFVIGGSLGVLDTVREKANFRLSFSKMTFPHQLAKCVLLEQIYRAFTILNNITYHK